MDSGRCLHLQFYIIGPYSTDFDYNSITGIPKKVRSAIKSKEMFDGTGVLVFSLRGEYVAYTEVGTRTLNPVGLLGGNCNNRATHYPNTIIRKENSMEKYMKMGKMEMARELKRAGVPVAQIVQASGLSEEEVESL